MSMIPGRFPKLPALDGVRGVAIIAVMVFHLWPAKISGGGRLGVDAFFVLSAFLITSILMTEHRGSDGQIDFRTFYAHRALRLAPALVLFLAVLAPLATHQAHLSHIFGNTLKSLFYVMDFAAADILLHGTQIAYHHVWSLSVEEQFYFLWPAALGVILARIGHEQRLKLFVGAAVAAWGVQLASVATIGAARTEPFFTGHVFPLALGVVAAECAVHGTPDWLQRLIRRPAIVSFALFGFAVTTVGLRGVLARHPDYGPSELANLAIFVIILHIAAGERSPVVRLLETAPMRWFGQRSYGLYLYHMPILILFSVPPISDAHIPNLVRMGFVAATSVVVAEASFRYVERPIARRGREWLAARRSGERATAGFAHEPRA